MKIIALRGDVDTGKSHTMNIAYSLLLRDGWVQVPGHFDVLGNPKFEDVFDILKKNGIKVGIIGMGDYQRGGGALATLIDKIIAKGAVIVICACRNIAAIEKAVTRYPNHFFIDKTPSAGRANDRIVNVMDAERLINLI